MKLMSSINRSGKLPPQPECPGIPDMISVPEIQFSPDAQLITKYRVYLVEETDYAGLMIVKPDEAFKHSGTGGHLLFFCTTDEKFPECRVVRTVARVVGMSKSGKTSTGIVANTVYYQELMRPGQSPQHIYYSLERYLHNVVISTDIGQERLVFRPSYDQLSLSSTNDDEKNVRWYYNGHADTSPLRCDITTKEGASVSNYTVGCFRLPATMISTAYIDQPGTGSLITGSLSVRDATDIHNYPALMFALVAVTNFGNSASAGNELKWLVFEKKSAQRNLVTMMFSMQLEQLLVVNEIQSSNMLMLACAESFID